VLVIRECSIPALGSVIVRQRVPYPRLTERDNASRVLGIRFQAQQNGAFPAANVQVGATATSGFTVSSTDDIMFGKKLNDNYPGDTFAGAIDQVTVYTVK